MVLPINIEFIKTYISSPKQHQHNIINFFKNWTTAKLIKIKSVENNYIKIMYDYYISSHSDFDESKSNIFNSTNLSKKKLFTYSTTTLNENKHIIKFIPMKKHIDMAINGDIKMFRHFDNYYFNCCKCGENFLNQCFNHVNTTPFVGDIDININIYANNIYANNICRCNNVCRCNNIYYSKLNPNCLKNSKTYICNNINCHTHDIEDSKFVKEKIEPHPNYYSKDYINDPDNDKITQILTNCSLYYQVLYEYNDSVHVFHYLNSCCCGDDLLFSESPNLDDVIIMTEQCQRTDLNYKLLRNICYSME